MVFDILTEYTTYMSRLFAPNMKNYYVYILDLHKEKLRRLLFV